MTEDASVRRAVLLVGHGTVSEPRDVPEFLRRIRHGRPAPEELSAEVVRRYARIGGSPFLTVARSVSDKLAARLGRPCRVAMRFWDPLVPDVVSELVRERFRRVCVLPLSPYSVSLYVNVVREALRDVPEPFEVVPVAPYGDSPELVRAHAAAVAPLLSGRSSAETALILTAHSLPVQVIAAGDRYAREFESAARAVAGALSWPFELAYQSAGASGGEWLGPTLSSVIERARTEGKRHVVIAPVGFLADHLETLYDLDVEALEIATRLGLGFSRARALNDDAALVDALAAVVKRADP